ncbi:MAG: hypothetical protein C4562_00335 [Actinobacteria bacterium]|nr:MAG: hypothetical protein C4562_00335 [Actinomycetota bacterium]
MDETYVLKAQKEIRTYAYLIMASYDSLEKARQIEEGSFYQRLSALLFSAFALEAFMNHIGERKIEFWEDIETINPLSKLRIIYHYMGLDFDSSKRPIQTVKKINKLRNFMVHGKTIWVKNEGYRKTSTYQKGEKLVEAKWERLCNDQKESEEAVEDIKSIINNIADVAGIDKLMLYSPSSGSFTIGKKT